MGLDMYLNVKIYPRENEDLKSISVEGVDPKCINYLSVAVLYWRKSNWIHHWFVSRVQKGNDDCKPYPVTREELETLLTTIEVTLEDKSLAPILLPPLEGFLFGIAEIDDFYWADLQITKVKLGNILANKEWNFFEYRSFW